MTLPTARAPPAFTPFHSRYLALVQRIEREFPVAGWRRGDVDIWPMARMDLFLDMFRQYGGDTSPPSAPALLNTARWLATPLANLWRSRRDLAHWVGWPRRAHAIFLGDGVSLDLIDGAWEDRYGEPVIAALERRGLSTFLMQGGDLNRLPWRRPTFAANVVSVWASLAGALARDEATNLPGHDALMGLLALEGVDAPSLGRDRLVRRAREASAAASAFERVLRTVRPRIAFTVTYYSGLGHAFVLACRRQGVLSVDLQHCPHDRAHKAYSWSVAPEGGYTTLPAVFWTWSADDAAHIRDWAERLGARHSSLHGGHTQLAPFLDDDHPATRAWDAKFAAMGEGARWEREILVALQPIGGHRARWEALAAEIEAAPASWRWWIRRHPASAPYQDAEYRRLVSLRRPNVVVDEALSLPLPALLRHMSVALSVTSGSAAEAAAFGVPALFISPEGYGQFSGLIARGQAAVIEVAEVVDRISRLPRTPVRPASGDRAPSLDAALQRLEEISDAHRESLVDMTKPVTGRAPR
jgi:hypothetical protein